MALGFNGRGGMPCVAGFGASYFVARQDDPTNATRCSFV